LRLLSAILIYSSLFLPKPFWLAPHRNEGFYLNNTYIKLLKKNSYKNIKQRFFHYQGQANGFRAMVYKLNYRFFKMIHLNELGCLNTIIVGEK